MHSASIWSVFLNKHLEFSLPIDIVSFWIWKWFDLEKEMGWKNFDGSILRKHSSVIGTKVWGAKLQAGFKLLCISYKKCSWQKTFAQKPKQNVTQLEEIRYFFWQNLFCNVLPAQSSRKINGLGCLHLQCIQIWKHNLYVKLKALDIHCMISIDRISKHCQRHYWPRGWLLWPVIFGLVGLVQYAWQVWFGKFGWVGLDW